MSSRSSLRWPGSPALVAVVTALLAAVAVPAGAGDGDLDPSFGGDGTVVLPLPVLADGYAKGVGVRVQPDGRIVALASYFEPGATGGAAALLLYRLLPNGALDPGFGSGGIVALRPYDFPMIGSAVELASDGKIVVGGSLDTGQYGWWWLIGRLLADGSPDSTFGSDGWNLVNFRPGHCCEDLLGDLAVGADGSVVAVGSTRVDADAKDAGFVRLTPNGLLDPTFGTAGRSSADLALGFPGHTTRVTDVVLEPSSGAFVFAGGVSLGTFDWWVMGRVGPAGSFDASFNATGYQLDDFDSIYPASDGARLAAVCRHADGSYLGVGDATPSGLLATRGGLVQLLADGSLDDAWGDSGFASFELGGPADHTNDVAACALDRAERAVCVGTIFIGGGGWVGIARWVGALQDSRYRGGGSDYFGFDLPSSSLSLAADVTFDPSGRIVVAGTVDYGNGAQAALARLIGGLPFTDGFESGDASSWSSFGP